MKSIKKQRGFSLIELLVAMSITIIVLAGVTMGFTRAMGSIQYAFSRTETQANARAAVNDIARDLTQASSGGVPFGGPGLTAGNVPLFAHDVNGTDYLAANTFTQPVLNPVTPAFGDGIAIPSVLGGANSDGIVILYEDQRVDNFPGYNWPNAACPQPAGGCLTFDAAGDTVTMPAGTTPAMNDPTVGLQVGDLVLFTNANGSLVEEVTNVVGPTIFNIANGDALQMNGGVQQQLGNFDNTVNPPAFTGYPPTKMYKLAMVSYYIAGIDANGNIVPGGGAGTVDYRLMRQVNGLPPVPVAEHIVNLKFTYDLADQTTGVQIANVPNAAPPPAAVPLYNEIWNVYVTVTARSPRTDPKGNYTYATLFTSVAPRNLSFNDRYK